MGKIAAELEQALARRAVCGSPGALTGRLLAEGEGWSVEDVICTSGPGDHPFEEQHDQVSISIVVAGSFVYRSVAGRELMTPGSLMLGSPGQYFECGHEHGNGDRCLAFRYRADHFESLMADTGGSGVRDSFRPLRLPPMRELAPLVALACAGVSGSAAVGWDELALRLAAEAIRLAGARRDRPKSAPAAAAARVTAAVRAIDRDPGGAHRVTALARDAGLSPYHFLRTFEQLTGVTPHRYVLRARLRQAAIRLRTDSDRVIEVAFSSGFGDVSNFNRAFRTEFGHSPRAYRKRVEI